MLLLRSEYNHYNNVACGQGDDNVFISRVLLDEFNRHGFLELVHCAALC
jgi:hypothetical protein